MCDGLGEERAVHSFRSNPPSRQIPPRPELRPRAVEPERARSSQAEAFRHRPPEGALLMVEQILHATDMTPSAFGRTIANDPRLVQDMRRGREPRPSLLSRISLFHGTVFGQQQEASHA
jgi:hypothetical protein